MQKIPQNQKEWLKVNFGLNALDTGDMYEPKELFSILTGETYFRGKNYQGNSNSFRDDWFLYLTDRMDGVRARHFNRTYAQLVYLMKEAEIKEYYELIMNISEVLDELKTVYNDVNEADADQKLRFLLIELGFKDNSI